MGPLYSQAQHTQKLKLRIEVLRGTFQAQLEIKDVCSIFTACFEDTSFLIDTNFTNKSMLLENSNPLIVN